MKRALLCFLLAVILGFCCIQKEEKPASPEIINQSSIREEKIPTARPIYEDVKVVILNTSKDIYP